MIVLYILISIAIYIFIGRALYTVGRSIRITKTYFDDSISAYAWPLLLVAFLIVGPVYIIDSGIKSFFNFIGKKY
jgi:hypothetical protein